MMKWWPGNGSHLSLLASLRSGGVSVRTVRLLPKMCACSESLTPKNTIIVSSQIEEPIRRDTVTSVVSRSIVVAW